ncbi:DoxX family membrane protein [Flavihumibacter rivuli]|uniref:DoxX family membrane protein n=1 Tax=Flavihumibacter rivuli TaxID=2838156 RepID=UPI001BDF4FEA|nr:DoxX family membrane protein [Flavihumibacter rivuli]ULQ55497.1 DoxX family membrane protein [Flavihumibacter rivuli]
MANYRTLTISKPSLVALRSSIGVIYIWFGMLKFFQGMSPAEQLAINTIHELCFGVLPARVSLLLLAGWETVLGLLLVSGLWKKQVIIALVVHMVCTFTPLLFFPQLSFSHAPYGFTLVGQYIMKNIVILAAAWVLWQTSDQ